MIRTIFGMKRVVNSILAGIDSRPRMGPITKPKKRSSAVQIPPLTTWKKSMAHSWLVAIVTTSPTRTTRRSGGPRKGTIWKVCGGRSPTSSLRGAGREIVTISERSP